ncbi:phosphopantetheine-binding protein [Frateuria sp. Soil773]|uniref:acyl carrier protein n=1 Tax=Frateuria sp. Soil773 TaxID=1736407 RepID=UPI0006FFDF48|nr:phosphopantetheine-binding protein [Frateuria sp. Soil773]KRE88428.1 phosphopantetheine-binding protein [Frateuria sp. Soil773]
MNAPLSDADIQSQVFGIIAKQAKIDAATLKPESTLKDLGVASLDAIEVIFDIEEHFDVTFPDQGTNFDTDTVQHLIDAVRSALDAKAAGPEAAA